MHFQAQFLVQLMAPNSTKLLQNIELHYEKEQNRQIYF